ncbi:uncharacterized protein [Palaemon carinicauda]|uniref:uncharacterized protein n=1 Tax=Palaemon carinicauda TaxID=392227 RepID=UPI0035B5FBA7
MTDDDSANRRSTLAGGQRLAPPQPLAYFSRKMCKAESGYSTFDCKLHLAVCHFPHALNVTSFVIHMDHMPLVHAFTRRSDNLSAHQPRYLSTVAVYNFHLQNVFGKVNLGDNDLSKKHISRHSPGIRLQCLGRIPTKEKYTLPSI